VLARPSASHSGYRYAETLAVVVAVAQAQQQPRLTMTNHCVTSDKTNYYRLPAVVAAAADSASCYFGEAGCCCCNYQAARAAVQTLRSANAAVEIDGVVAVVPNDMVLDDGAAAAAVDDGVVVDAALSSPEGLLLYLAELELGPEIAAVEFVVEQPAEDDELLQSGSSQALPTIGWSQKLQND